MCTGSSYNSLRCEQIEMIKRLFVRQSFLLSKLSWLFRSLQKVSPQEYESDLVEAPWSK